MACRPILLGHRGVRGDKSIPENSLAAFDRALEEGCDGFEFDVRLTACGHMVICHDPKVNGIAICCATVAELPHLPEFPDVLQRYSRRGFLDIEIKVSGLEAKVLTALREHPPELDYVVSSFLPDVLLELKARSELVPVGIICEKAGQLVGWNKLPVDYVMAHKSLVTRKLVQSVHETTRKLLVWTVNDPSSMLRLAGWGVDGIISDDPGLLARTLA